MPGSRVQDFYARSGSGAEIANRIISALRAAAGASVAIDPETLAPFDHVHARGLAGTRAVADLLQPKAGDAILDIGSGIGGPARWIAANYLCMVTGVDLTREYCDAARELNVASGMSNRVRILEGSATELPLPDATFDAAYSQFALMNIADKAAFYREAFRVLKPGGRLVLFHLNAGPNGTPDFPLPWAAVPENSFLTSDAATRRDLTGAGFQVLCVPRCCARRSGRCSATPRDRKSISRWCACTDGRRLSAAADQCRARIRGRARPGGGDFGHKADLIPTHEMNDTPAHRS